MRNLDAYAINIGIMLFIIFSFIFISIEHSMFLLKVQDSVLNKEFKISLESYSKTANDPELLLYKFLFRVVRYGIPAYISGFKAKESFFLHSFALGLFCVILSITARLITNPRFYIDYFYLSFAEIIFSLLICSFAGFIVTLQKNKKFLK